MNASAFARLLLLGAIWGAAFMFMRIAVPEFGAIALAGVRVALACAIMLAIVAVMRLRFPLRTHWKRYLAIGGVNTAGPFIMYCFAALYIPSAYSAIGNSTTPIWGALIAWLMFKEKLGALKWLGIVAAFAGVVALVGLQPVAITPMIVLGMIAVLVGAMMYATASFLIKRYLSDDGGIVGATGMVFGATVWLVPLALFTTPTKMPSVNAWGAVLALAVFCTVLGYFMFFKLIREIGPQRASSVAFLFPAFAAFWGWLFIDEPITANMLIGMALVLVGTALVSRGNVRPNYVTLWERVRDWFLFPFIFAALPKTLQRRFARWVMSFPLAYRFECEGLRVNLPKYFPAHDVEAAVRDLRFTRLTDQADLWIGLLRGKNWFTKNVSIEAPQALKTPALFLTFHYGGGWWMTRWLREKAWPVSIVMRRGEPEPSLQSRFAHWIGTYRMRKVEAQCGAPLIRTDEGGAAREVLRTWRSGTSVIGLIDLPPPLVDRTETVSFLGKAAQFPPTLITLAHRASVPVYCFIGQWSFAEMRPTVTIVAIDERATNETLQNAVDELSRALALRPGAWHAWSEIDFYFGDAVIAETLTR